MAKKRSIGWPLAVHSNQEAARPASKQTAFPRTWCLSKLWRVARHAQDGEWLWQLDDVRVINFCSEVVSLWYMSSLAPFYWLDLFLDMKLMGSILFLLCNLRQRKKWWPRLTLHDVGYLSAREIFISSCWNGNCSSSAFLGRQRKARRILENALHMLKLRYRLVGAGREA